VKLKPDAIDATWRCGFLLQLATLFYHFPDWKMGLKMPASKTRHFNLIFSQEVGMNILDVPLVKSFPENCLLL